MKSKGCNCVSLDPWWRHQSVLLDNDLEATAAALVAEFIDTGLVPLEDEKN